MLVDANILLFAADENSRWESIQLARFIKEDCDERSDSGYKDARHDGVEQRPSRRRRGAARPASVPVDRYSLT